MCSDCVVLIKNIDAFSLKKSQKEDWNICSGDIVINKKIWREIKRKYLNSLQYVE